MSSSLDLGTVRVKLAGDSSSWERELNNAVQKMKDYESEVTLIQQRINNQFKASTQEAVDAIRRAYEQSEIDYAQLEEEKFAATHSRMEVELRKNEQHYAKLREQYKNHQDMMTLIAQTEEAKRQRIIQDFQNSYNPMASFGIVRSYLRVAGVIYTIVSSLDAIAEANRAIREGGDPLAAFAKNLPIVGGIERTFEKLLWEIGGLNAELERSERIMQGVAARADILKDNFRRREMLSIGDNGIEKEIAQARFAHEDRMAQLEEQKNAILKRNQIIQQSIKDTERNLLIGGMYKENKIEELKAQLQSTKPVIGLINAEMKTFSMEVAQMRAKPIEDIAKALRAQGRELTMTETELNVYKAALLGATPAQQEYIRQLSEMVEKTKQEVEARKEAERQTKLQTQALKQWADAAKESIRSVEETIADTKEKIDQAIASGFMTKDQGAAVLAQKQKEEFERANKDVIAFAENAKKALQTPRQELQEYWSNLTKAVSLGLMTMKQAQDSFSLKQKEVVEKANKEIISFSESVKKSIQTPAQELQAYQKQLKEAVNKRYLTKEEATKAYEQKKKELDDEADKELGSSGKSSASRQVQGYESITGMRVGKNPIEDLSKKQDRTNYLLDQINRGIQNNSSDTYN